MLFLFKLSVCRRMIELYCRIKITTPFCYQCSVFLLENTRILFETDIKSIDEQHFNYLLNTHPVLYTGKNESRFNIPRRKFHLPICTTSVFRYSQMNATNTAFKHHSSDVIITRTNLMSRKRIN